MIITEMGDCKMRTKAGIQASRIWVTNSLTEPTLVSFTISRISTQDRKTCKASDRRVSGR